MSYLFLGMAIVAEVIGTSLIKSTNGFTKLWPTVATLTSYGLAFFLLSRSLQAGMQTGVAYAIWSGLGTALIVVIAMLFLGEPLTVAKAGGVALIIAGVVLLNLTTSAH